MSTSRRLTKSLIGLQNAAKVRPMSRDSGPPWFRPLQLIACAPRRSAPQRLRPLGNRARTHADRHQTVVRPGGGGQRGGRLYKVQRAQATRTALTAAQLTASRRRQLAVSTRRRNPLLETHGHKAAARPVTPKSAGAKPLIRSPWLSHDSKSDGRLLTRGSRK